MFKFCKHEGCSRAVVLLLAIMTEFPLFGTVLGIWPGDGESALRPAAAPKRIVKTTSKDGVYSVKLTGELAPRQRLQIKFNKPYKLTAGTRFRISVEMKADPEVKVNMGVMSAQSPYRMIRGSIKKCRVISEYQIFSREFISDKNYESPFNTPFVFTDNAEKGNCISIRKVVFESIEGGILPLPETSQWTLFVKPGVKPEELAEITSIPTELGSAEARSLAVGKTAVPIPDLSRERDEAILMTMIESPADGQMQAGFSADWWAEIYVNGNRCASTLVTGNGSYKFVPDDHVFNFKVKKGKNLLVAYVKSGMKGGKFAFGAVKYRQKLKQITEVVRSNEWRPVKMDDAVYNAGRHIPPPPGISEAQWKKERLVLKRLDQLKIIPGSALDMSQYLPHYDIDRLGFLIADKDGHLVSSREPSVRVKLRGFNFAIGQWWTWFFRLTHEEIEEFAEQIRLSGMNVVRLHRLNRFLIGDGGYPRSKHKRPKASQVDFTANPDELPIDKASLDRLDYFTKCLRDRGIYVIADVCNGSFGWTLALTPDSDEDYFRYQLYIDAPGKRAHYAAAFRFLMNHVNPYTGKKYKDDPQFMAITCYNEIDHVFSGKKLPLFDRAFRKYCRGKNLSVKSPFSQALLAAATPEGDAARSFLLETIDSFNAFLLDLTRREGYRGFVTLYDMNVRHLCGWSRRNFNAVAMHTYHAHPSKPVKLDAPDFKQRRWNSKKMVKISQKSSIASGRSYIGKAAATRVLSKPFFMTEYAHSNYNQFTQEGGIVTGAYAALQDWDMLTPHANILSLYYRPMGSDFESLLSMTQRAGWMLSGFAWQRGDVAPAKKSIDLNIPEKITRSADLLGSIGTGHNFLFMLAKIGSSYDEKSRGDFRFLPTKFSKVTYHGLHVMQQDDSEVQDKELEKSVAALKKGGILPDSNRTDVKNGIFESETGEILADVKNHTLRVVTPRLESLVLKPGQKLKGDLLTVDSASIPVTVSAVSIDGKEPIASANRLLLLVQTMSVAEHTVFLNENFDFVLDGGEFKVLERTGKFRISLKMTRKSSPRLYALNPNGSREKELPVSFKDGNLFIDLDTSKLEYGTPFFELVY